MMDSVPSDNNMQEAPKSNRNMMLYIIGAIVLCCFCVAIGVGGYYGYQAYIAAQQAVQDIQDIIPEIPTSFPIDPNDPNSPNIPIPGFGDAPEGGLADDLSRQLAWTQVVAYSSFVGCSSPQVGSTEIAVSTEPDANGTWQEEWDVDCGDGSSYVFTVDYTTDSGIVTPIVQIPAP